MSAFAKRRLAVCHPLGAVPSSKKTGGFWFLPMTLALASLLAQAGLPPVAVSPAGFATAAVPPPDRIVALQVDLARRGFRVGPIDGMDGPRTRAALKAFQQSAGVSVSPGSHPESAVQGPPPILTRYIVTREDLASLGAVPTTWLGKSKAGRLPYESLLEAMAERSATHPQLLRILNPAVSWDHAAPGTPIILPNVQDPPAKPAARVSINLKTCTLQALDAAGAIQFMAPCSIGRVASSRPVGLFKVVSIVHNPTYTFDPARFPESPEARSLDRRLLLPPGPNNPVGVAWIGLDRPGIGIHGTPSPEKVGRPESHGCFRLANWDAAHLARISWPGLPVEVGDRE